MRYEVNAVILSLVQDLGPEKREDHDDAWKHCTRLSKSEVAPAGDGIGAHAVLVLLLEQCEC